MVGVYIIRRIDTGDCYVGGSISIEERWKGHRKSLLLGNHHSPYLQRAWSKHGGYSFEFVVLEKCDRQHVFEREQYWMDTLSPVYNVAKAARGPLGVVRSPETRAKCRAANLGQSPPNKGIPMSEEQKKKVRGVGGKNSRPGNKFNLGKVRSASARALSSIAMRGHVWSAETQAKRTASRRRWLDANPGGLRGWHHSDETRAKLRITARRREDMKASSRAFASLME